MSSIHRIPCGDLRPDAAQMLSALSAGLTETSLGRRLVELLCRRISEFNGCAFCAGTRRCDPPACPQTDFFDDRTRAALTWADAVTDLRAHRNFDAEYEVLKRHFSEGDIAALTFAVAAITAWNRSGAGPGLPAASCRAAPG